MIREYVFLLAAVASNLSMTACQTQGAGPIDTFADARVGGGGGDAGPGANGVWRAIGDAPITSRSVLDAVPYQGGTLLALGNPVDSAALHVVFIDGSGVASEQTFAAGVHKNIIGAEFAVTSDGTAYLSAYQSLGSPGIHLYRLADMTWTESLDAYLPDARQFFSMTDNGNGIVLGHLDTVNIPTLQSLETTSQTWSQMTPIVATGVNDVKVASGQYLAVATVNSGGTTSSLYEATGNPWTTISSDFTGIVGELEIAAGSDRVVLRESVPEGVLHQVRGGVLSELYRAPDGHTFAGLAVEGEYAYTFDFEGSLSSLLRVGANGVDPLPISDESGGSLQVPVPSSAGRVRLVSDDGIVRAFYGAVDGVHAVQLDLSP